jgi:hypothetical protein
MNWLQHHRLLVSALLAGILALIGEIWALSQVRQQARRARRVLEDKMAERDRLARQSPALTVANEQATALELARDAQVLAGLRLALQGRDQHRLAITPPPEPIDAYFEIAALAQQSRVQAANAHVAIRPDEQFGFAAYASEGPRAEAIPAVFRQCLVTQYLLESLFAAQPQGLLCIQHEPAVTETGRNGPGTAAGDPPGADCFRIDPQLSLRVPGRIRGEAYHLEFIGQTATLRTFLNALAAFQLPLVVRGVEVVPLTKELTGASPAGNGSKVPVNGQSLSKFSVVVELIELAPSAKEPAP